MTIFSNFLKKKSSFWQFFDSQMAIFRKVREATINTSVKRKSMMLQAITQQIVRAETKISKFEIIPQLIRACGNKFILWENSRSDEIFVKRKSIILFTGDWVPTFVPDEHLVRTILQ